MITCASPRSALIRLHSAIPSPPGRFCSSSTTSGRSRASSSWASPLPAAVPTGTMPGSPRSSMTSPARTAGCGSMTATRVTIRTLSALLQPDLKRRCEPRRFPPMQNVAVLVALAALLAAAPAAAAAPRYAAEIRRTEGGMPHVKARDYGSLGFGLAYAYAEDQGCRFADIIATVRARRSRYFGPDAGYGHLGGRTNNLASDFFFQRIKDS